MRLKLKNDSIDGRINGELEEVKMFAFSKELKLNKEYRSTNDEF